LRLQKTSGDNNENTVFANIRGALNMRNHGQRVQIRWDCRAGTYHVANQYHYLYYYLNNSDSNHSFYAAHPVAANTADLTATRLNGGRSFYPRRSHGNTAGLSRCDTYH
jgi:hypothetical protein